MSQIEESTRKSPADPIPAGDFSVFPVEKPVDSVENCGCEIYQNIP